MAHHLDSTKYQLYTTDDLDTTTYRTPPAAPTTYQLDTTDDLNTKTYRIYPAAPTTEAEPNVVADRVARYQSKLDL